jgi:hypothetical protein
MSSAMLCGVARDLEPSELLVASHGPRVQMTWRVTGFGSRHPLEPTRLRQMPCCAVAVGEQSYQHFGPARTINRPVNLLLRAPAQMG